MTTLPGSGQANVLGQNIPCQPGDSFALTLGYRNSVGATGAPDIHIGFYTAAGVLITGSNQDWYGSPQSTAAWGTFTAVSAVAPLGAVYALVYAGLANLTGATGSWWFGDLVAIRQRLGATLASDASGKAIVAPSSLGQGNLVPGALSNATGQGWNSSAGPCIVNYGLPSYASYAIGQLLFDTVDDKTYRNTGYPTGWVRSTDPADLLAGVIAAGVTIAAAQVLGGTPAQPTSVVLSEVGPRFIAAEGEGRVCTTLRATLTGQGASAIYAYVNMYASDGVTQLYNLYGGAQSYPITSGYVDFQIYVPTANTAMIAMVSVNSASAQNGWGSAVASAAVTINAIGAAANNQVTVAAGAVTYACDWDGNWSWSMPLTVTVAAGDVNMWAVELTRENGSYSGSTWVPDPTCLENIEGGIWSCNAPGTYACGAVTGWGAPPASATARVMKFRAYARSRQDGNDASTMVLQATAWSGAAYLDVTPAVQTGEIPAVVSLTQPGPGNASGWADSVAQAWANNLLTGLRDYGAVS